MPEIGGKYQVRAGARDVTNGKAATAGRLYGEGGPLWMTLVAIVPNWNTGGIAGLPATVTKYRCVGSDGSTVVWQVQEQDLVGGISPEPAPPAPPAPEPVPPAPEPEPPVVQEHYDERRRRTFNLGSSSGPYAPDDETSNWSTGTDSNGRIIETGHGVRDASKTAHMSESMFAGDAGMMTPTYEEVRNIWPTERKDTMTKSMKQLGHIYRARYKTSWQSAGRQREMLNKDASIIQNAEGFPYHVGPGPTNRSDIYDYQIIPNDKRYSRVASLEDRLMKFRASVGLQVHGDTSIARSVKFYMYNRFKVPDTNLAHNKTFTHIFFTRPDLYLLEPGKTDLQLCQQASGHTDTAILWMRHPEIFKMLTDRNRCGDTNNFNMLLSNQIASFQLQDEELSVIYSTQSWAEHKMAYGEQYTGRTAGQITCNFTETSEYSVLNLVKLWMTYIDNVSRGAWHPYYGYGNNLLNCPVGTRSLDYGASIYVFKCGPDGEDVLYWSKYYGVFPISSGASGLGWEAGTVAGSETPRLSINFAYSFKRDMSPISLLEFNHVAGVGGMGTSSTTWEPAYPYKIGSEDINHTSRPFVGCPYIEIDLGKPDMTLDDVRKGTKDTHIRLKFRKDNNDDRRDDVLFKASF